MTTLAKRYSPLTKSVGSGKINRSVTLTEIADAMLPKIAHACGEPNVNEFARRAMAFYAESKLGAQAVAFKIAIRSRAGLMVFFAFAIPALSFVHGEDFEVRRPRRMSMSRSAARMVRRQEVAA